MVASKHLVSLRQPSLQVGEVFRTDAKAEGSKIVVGGWEVLCGQRKWESRWFSVVLTEASAPWAFCRGLPYRTIAALELFGTLLGVLAFGDRIANSDDAEVCFTGATDHLGNECVVRRGLTTRYPLCLIHMELTAQLEARNAALSLKWRRRELNQEADDLTNEVFDGFNPARRVDLSFAKGEWLVLDWLIGEAQAMYDSLSKIKAGSALPAKRRRRNKVGLRYSDPW